MERFCLVMFLKDLGSIPGSVGAGSKEDRSEWERRAVKFQTKVAEIERIFLKLCHCDNRELVSPVKAIFGGGLLVYDVF